MAALAWLAGHGLAPRPTAPPVAELTRKAEPSSGGASGSGGRPEDRGGPNDGGGSGSSGGLAGGSERCSTDAGWWFEAPPGCPGDWPELRTQPGAVVEAIGNALARLHSLPPVSGASSPRLRVLEPADLVALAAERVRQGLVDPANFERARASLGPERLLVQAERLLPLLAERAERRPVHVVPTHGAARPEAFWLHQDRVQVLLGVAGLALAEPYRDLAAISRWLVSNVSAEALPAFFTAYGLPDPDPVRLEFHVLLDELR